MVFGSFGSISFSVSTTVVKTFNSMKWTSLANYSMHKIHGKKAINEFVGLDSDKITFEMTLSAFMGVNPKKELEKLEKIMKDAKSYALVLGTNVIGNRWVLTNISRDIQQVYKEGDLLEVKVQVTLLEE